MSIRARTDPTLIHSGVALEVQQSSSPGPEPARPSVRPYVTVLALALGLRLVWLLAVPVVPLSDCVRYDFFAQRLAAGLGYTEIDGTPTAYWPVGPSFLFSLAYRLTGPESEMRFLPVAVMNLVLGVGSVALTMYLASRWFSRRVAMVAGLLLALWPSQIQFTTVLASETPMIFLMLAALAIWTAEWPGWLPRAVPVGLLLAGASFMRPTGLLLPVVFGLSDLVHRPRPMRTIASVAVAMVVMLAAILPWSLRNQRVFGEFVLISTNSGTNTWMGNNPQTSGAYQPPLPSTHFGGEVERSRELHRQAREYIKAEPVAFLKRTLVKAVRLHERESIGVGWNERGLERTLDPLGPRGRSLAILALKLGSNVYWWAVLLLALLGTGGLVWWRSGDRPVMSSARRRLAWLAYPPVLIWAYFTAVHAATVIQDRYHFASIPFIAILAAVGGCAWCQRTKPGTNG